MKAAKTLPSSQLDIHWAITEKNGFLKPNLALDPRPLYMYFSLYIINRKNIISPNPNNKYNQLLVSRNCASVCDH